MRRLAVAIGIACVPVLLLPTIAAAQQRASIVGVVQDVSGTVMPGVTVEASSPALIEQVRTAVTDGAGRYTIIDLRPGTSVAPNGTYTMTNLRNGFSKSYRAK